VAQGRTKPQGLNHGIEQLDADWIVCLHQDVQFPGDFWQRLTTSLTNVPGDVALAGLVGCERSGRFCGYIVDPNGHCYWPSLPRQVLALDEVMIALRKSSGLRFCEEVPGFHCYGADICFETDRQGLKTMAVDAPLVHLSTGKLDDSYDRALVVPGKLYEALASERPVLGVLPPGDGADLIESTQAGVVVPPTDAEALAKALGKMVAAHQNGTVSSGCDRSSMSGFSGQSLTGRLAAVFGAAVSRKPGLTLSDLWQVPESA
jgi:hypothetical protein